MAKTQTQLLLEARHRLDETTAHAWSDDVLRVWINEAARDIARKTETLMTKAAPIAVAANVRTATMPTDMIRATRVEWKANSDSQIFPLEPRDYNAADEIWGQSQAISTGTPYIFALFGFPPTLTIYLYPTPAVAGVLNVFYYRLPTELATATTTSGGSTVEIPEGWYDLILDYIEMRALRRDKDPDWQSAKQIYDEHLLDMHDTTRRWMDQAGVITSGAGQGVPRWLWDENF